MRPRTTGLCGRLMGAFDHILKPKNAGALVLEEAEKPEPIVMAKETVNPEPAEARAEAVKPTPTPEEQKPDPIKDLPSLDNGASSYYDIDKGVWWMGIPLSTLPLLATAMLDAGKLDFLKAQQQFAQKQAARSKLGVGLGSKAKESLGDMFKRMGDQAKKLLH